MCEEVKQNICLNSHFKCVHQRVAEYSKGNVERPSKIVKINQVFSRREVEVRTYEKEQMVSAGVQAEIRPCDASKLCSIKGHYDSHAI